MRLYSRHHIIGSLFSGAAIFFAVFYIGIKTGTITISLNKKNSENSEVEKTQPAENVQTAAQSSATAQKAPESVQNPAQTSAANTANPAKTPAPAVSANTNGYTQDEEQNIFVYEKCNEAVVNINTQVTGINWFLEPIVQAGGSGSGSIIDQRGYVITNVHVIENASRIYISLSDGTQYEGSVVGQDTESDIAVLKFTPPKGTILKTISFGDSKTLKVGQKVIAIGNPFGLERTMTTGIVSGLGRPIQNSNNTIIRDMIQTDTAINPGNSGGPLLNTKGQMIGINTMIYSSSGNSAGVGFAVPSETARRVANELIQNGKVTRGAIQAKMFQLNSIIARYANLDISTGLLVSEVMPGGNADVAGIKGGTEAVRYGSRSLIYLGGDIITGIDGVAVATIADYYSLLESKRPGNTVTVRIHRDRKDINVKVKLAEQASD